MVSYFSIIQYVPNPIIGERINIGVVTTDGQRTYARFLQNWSRVENFSLENNIDFLKNFAEKVIKEKQLFDFANAACTYKNTIQITAPRASLKKADILLNEICSRFLIEVEIL